MESIHIHGGVGLQGKVRIQGSKNAVLPVLAATILINGASVVKNCPRIADVYRMLNLLKSLGCKVSWEEDGVRVDAAHVSMNEMPAEAITGMRSSLCMMGALLGRTGHFCMEHPGGCVIGARPIDMHLDAFGRMGAIFREEGKRIFGSAENGLSGADIHLRLSSVGATENVILAAVMAQGMTRVFGAAMEPEVEALCRFLEQSGARIAGIGTDKLVIEGGFPLYGTEYRIPADRIVAGTYLFGALAAGGSILLEEAPVEQMGAVLKLAAEFGAECQASGDGLYVQSPEQLLPVTLLRTTSYPGFPTDLQSIVLPVLGRIEAECLVQETIFENRFRVAGPLNQMGARIEILDEKRAMVRGISPLQGCEVEAEELRGGAALIVAGLCAEGETVVRGCQYIDRGYENICKDFRELGARIYRVSE